jgi:hypothetical protein
MLYHAISTAINKTGYLKKKTTRSNICGYLIAKFIKAVTKQCNIYVKLAVKDHMNPLPMRLCAFRIPFLYRSKTILSLVCATNKLLNFQAASYIMASVIANVFIPKKNKLSSDTFVH